MENYDDQRTIHRIRSNTAAVVTFFDILVVVLSCLAGCSCGIGSYKCSKELNKRLQEVRMLFIKFNGDWGFSGHLEFSVFIKGFPNVQFSKMLN